MGHIDHDGPLGNARVVIDGKRTPLGYQQITELESAVGFTSVPVGANCALVQIADQAIRWRDDGTSPTADVGMPQAAGTERVYFGDLTAIEFIESADGAELNVSFYGL